MNLRWPWAVDEHLCTQPRDGGAASRHLQQQKRLMQDFRGIYKCLKSPMVIAAVEVILFDSSSLISDKEWASSHVTTKIT